MAALFRGIVNSVSCFKWKTPPSSADRVQDQNSDINRFLYYFVKVAQSFFKKESEHHLSLESDRSNMQTTAPEPIVLTGTAGCCSARKQIRRYTEAWWCHFLHACMVPAASSDSGLLLYRWLELILLSGVCARPFLDLIFCITVMWC